jgi:hypothetical protein
MTETPLRWRTSTFSGPDSTCVEMAPHPDGLVLVRNSNHPSAGTLTVPPNVLAAWLDDLRAR